MTTTTTRTDKDVKTAVVDELSWLPSINSANIGVSVTDGAVTLSGEVDSYQEKIAAGKVTQRVHGVTAIAQEINLRATDVANADDSDVARGATAALLAAVNVPSTIKASVHDHVITLSGEGWHFERQAASRAVRYLAGVRDVIDDIRVRTSTPVIPTTIKSSIDKALVRNDVIHRTGVTVTCDPQGGVVLNGSVRSWDERRQCEDTAWAAPGVSSVTDNLHVEL